MAFPYILQAGFEAGATNFDTAKSDADSKISYPWYYNSVRSYGVAPYRGAYMMMVNLDTGTITNNAYQTQAAFNISASGAWGFGFGLFLHSSFTMANTNRATIARICSGTTTDEACVQLYYTTAGGYQILFTETSATAVGANPVAAITKGVWHWVDCYGTLDSGVGNDGSASLYVDQTLIGSLANLDQAAITDLYVGVSDADSGMSGKVFFDTILADDGRVPFFDRFPQNPEITASGHIFLGPGTIRAARMLTTTSSDETLKLYDTDTATTTYGSGASYVDCVAEVRYNNTELNHPVTFSRGCYAVIAGTNPRAQVYIDYVPPMGYPAPVHYSDAGVKRLAMVRK